MGLKINTNIAALTAHKNMINNDNKLSESLTRLSTGLRINKSADDASGMAIADSLKSQHLGIGQAIRNANDALSIIQIADGSLEESINILNTIKTKTIQAASDTQTRETRLILQNDINKLMEELDSIVKNTSFNGQKLLSGAFTNKKIQIDAYANITTDISIQSSQSNKTGHITQAKLDLANENGGFVQLVITSSITGEELTLNTINIQANNKSENGMEALADEINRYASTTGISANAVVSSTSSTNIKSGETGDDFSINGVNIGGAINVQRNDADNSLIKGINNKSSQHGVTASISSGGELILKSIDGRGIDITGLIGSADSVTPIFSASEMSTIGYINLTQKGATQFQISDKAVEVAALDMTLSSDTALDTDSILKVGTVIKSGTVLQQDMATELSETIDGSAEALLSGHILTKDMYVISDITLGAAGMTLAKGSEIKAGSSMIAGIAGTTAEDITLSSDMAVDKDTNLAIDTLIKQGTVLKENMTLSTDKAGGGGTTDSYNTGDILPGDRYVVDVAILLTESMTLAKGSIIKTGSKILAGMTLSSDMAVNKDTILQKGTLIKEGTVLKEDMTLDALSTGSGTSTASGTTLASDMYVVISNITLSADMTLAKDSVIATGSTIKSSTITSTISIDLKPKTNIQASESIIRDVDFAEEAMNFARMQLLAQTGSYAMAQANASTQYILSLLQ
ncbi:MAG: hypothetical protein B6I26_00440 [Desulfobacteraceae bacterium 4572_130]|nr:MAG: hypothetical protein B6I26_00440 [Desulfobacteraceae bacterium 4572_130]